MARKKTRKYVNFAESNNLFAAVEHAPNTIPRLPAGVYDLKRDQQSGRLYYDMIDTNHDEILDLPSPEYQKIIKQIEKFLSPECRARFAEKKYLYKRSTLLYGKPGTGKTCIVNRVVDTVVSSGGIVLFCPIPSLLTDALSQLQDIQPEVPIVVIFEELDKLMGRFEGELLSILDGEIQKENVIYLATTNFFHQIPPRMKRPGRFNNLVEVGFPDASVRKFYLDHKLGVDYPGLSKWVDSTEGFSIDELSETVRQVYCLEEDLEETIERVRKVKADSGADMREDDNPYDKDDEFDMNDIARQMLALEKAKRKLR